MARVEGEKGFIEHIKEVPDKVKWPLLIAAGVFAAVGAGSLATIAFGLSVGSFVLAPANKS